MSKIFTKRTLSETGLVIVAIVLAIGFAVGVLLKVSVPTDFVTLVSTVVGGLLGFVYHTAPNTTTTPNTDTVDSSTPTNNKVIGS